MARRTSETEYHGLLVLDKPGGMTSRDAVNQIQRTLPRGTKIGHTGTLDPLATGVLVVCLGHATRLAEYVQAMGKTYRSTFLLGATSDTDDADGTVTATPGVRPASRDAIDAALARFVGEIEQVPPAYSAAKVAGRRAYDLARRGTEVDLLPRRVSVDGIDVLSFAWPNLEVEVRCAKGTYIRSIARDLGAALGCGGLVTALRRTRVGPFTTEQAIPLDVDIDTICLHLRPMSDAVAELPRVELDDAEAERLRNGQAIQFRAPTGELALFCDGNLVGIAESDGARLRPSKIIPTVE
jgi:tRNA pseudouridine55 synthase